MKRTFTKYPVCASTQSSAKSYVYQGCRIYNTGNGFVVYDGNKAISPEFNTSDEAEEFVDEECSNDITSSCVKANTSLEPTQFNRFLKSKQASKPLKSVAAQLLAEWYNREGASIRDIDYQDIGEMANAASDDLDRAVVFYAMGYWDSDNFKEALAGMQFDEDEIESIMRRGR